MLLHPFRFYRRYQLDINKDIISLEDLISVSENNTIVFSRGLSPIFKNMRKLNEIEIHFTEDNSYICKINSLKEDKLILSYSLKYRNNIKLLKYALESYILLGEYLDRNLQKKLLENFFDDLDSYNKEFLNYFNERLDYSFEIFSDSFLNPISLEDNIFKKLEIFSYFDSVSSFNEFHKKKADAFFKYAYMKLICDLSISNFIKINPDF